MLSEDDKRDLKAMAASQRVREEFEALRALSRLTPGDLSVDQLINFLNCVNRLPAFPPAPRALPIWTKSEL